MLLIAMMINAVERFRDRAVRVAQAQALAKQVRAIVGGNVAVLLLTVIVLWPVAPRPTLLGWAGAILLASAPPLVLGHWLRRDPWDPLAIDRFLRGSLLSAWIRGVAWGSSGWLFAEPGLPSHSMFLAFVVGGMCAGALASSSFQPLAGGGFMLFGLMPTILWLLLQPEFVEQAMGLALLGYLLFLSMTLWNGYTRWVDLVRGRETIAQLAVALTEQRDLARRADAAKSRFLANMSHEIRTPLSGVIGLLGLLRADVLDPGSRQKVEMASRAADILMGVIGNILDLSKLEAGAVGLDAAPFELAALVEDAMRILVATASLKQIELRTEMARAARRWYVGDGTKLRQVLINLLGNAVKFTAKGGVVLHIDARDDGEWSHLTFAVIDTGIGIEADHIPLLLQAFHQADETIVRRFGGTGLGLAISRQYVELMGGRIEIESKFGEGATFRFALRLPLSAAPEPPAAAGSGREHRLQGRRILLVEDDVINRFAGSALLASCGAEVETAEDGAAGVTKAARAPFDLILMDMRLPVLDGLEATRRIRAASGPNRLTPILALTANAFVEDIERCLAAGMNGHLVKPLDVDAVATRLAGLAERY